MVVLHVSERKVRLWKMKERSFESSRQKPPRYGDHLTFAQRFNVKN